jgi:hypothetical protein
MSGLDSVKQTETTETAVSPQVKPAAIKSKYAIPAPTGTMPLDPSILESMQEIIAQKEAKRSSFGEGLKDVMAYDVGYGGNISKSIAERDAAKDQGAADIFQMKNQIAQYKAAQEQAQRQARSLGNIATGQPATGAGTVGGVAVPSSVRAEMNRRLQNNDLAGAQKVYEDWFKTETEETIKMETSSGAYEKKVEMEGADGKTFWVDPLTARQMRTSGTAKPTGNIAQSAPTSGGITAANIAKVESGGDPNAVSPKGARGVMQVMPNTQKDPGFGVAAAKDDSPAELQRVGEDYYAAMQKKYGNDTLAAIAYNMGPGATDDWLSKGGDFNKLPAETQSYIGKVYTTNALASRQPATSTTPAAASPAPAAASAAPLGAVRTETKTREAAEKEGSTAVAQSLGKNAAETGAAIDKAGLSAGDDFVLASEIVKIATDNTMQEMFGVLEKGGVAPFVLRQLQNAVNAGQFGTIGVKDLADNLAKAGATPDQIAKYDRMVRNLATAELKFAQTYLKGQGAVSDAERELIKKAVGSASGNPAKVLALQGQIMQERARFDADMAKAYDAYRDKYGDFANPSKFMRTEGRALIQKHNRDLAKIIGVDPAETANNMPYKTGATPGQDSNETKTPGGIKFKVIKPKS